MLNVVWKLGGLASYGLGPKRELELGRELALAKERVCSA